MEVLLFYNYLSMEKNKFSLPILLLTVIFVANGQNLFNGVSIDPNLLVQASAAILDLANYLNTNLDCRPSVPTQWGGINLRRSFDEDWNQRRYLLDEYEHHDFKSIFGFSGYHSINPKLQCWDWNDQIRINQ